MKNIKKQTSSSVIFILSNAAIISIAGFAWGSCAFDPASADISSGVAPEVLKINAVAKLVKAAVRITHKIGLIQQVRFLLFFPS